MHAEKSRRWLRDVKNMDRRNLDLAHIACEEEKPEEARQSLQKFSLLGKRKLSGAEAGKIALRDAWFHSCFARVCRLDRALFENYPVEKIFAEIGAQRHPWNLWLNNCGRLLLPENPNLARKMLFLAADMCREHGHGGTMTAMEMLPLAALGTDQDERRANVAWDRLKNACGPGKLNADHFREVLEAPDVFAALAAVENSQAQLFPFNYR